MEEMNLMACLQCTYSNNCKIHKLMAMSLMGDLIWIFSELVTDVIPITFIKSPSWRHVARIISCSIIISFVSHQFSSHQAITEFHLKYSRFSLDESQITTRHLSLFWRTTKTVFRDGFGVAHAVLKCHYPSVSAWQKGGWFSRWFSLSWFYKIQNHDYLLKN